MLILIVSLAGFIEDEDEDDDEDDSIPVNFKTGSMAHKIRQPFSHRPSR
jgi:hypothetical protein